MSLVRCPVITKRSDVTFYLILGCSIACMKLEEYQTAKEALERGASLAPGDPKLTDLLKECDELIAGKQHLFFIYLFFGYFFGVVDFIWIYVIFGYETDMCLVDL